MVSEQAFESMLPDVVIDEASQISDRKHRLFVCACCRRFWHLIEDLRSQESVRIAELFVDRLTTRTKLSVAYREARKAENELKDRQLKLFLPLHAAKYACASKIQKVTSEVSWTTAMIFVPDAKSWKYIQEESRAALESEAKTQIALLRDVFERPARIEPFWLTSGVVNLAKTIYDNKAFDQMPVLGNALLNAGCDNGNIIDHCRSDSPHIRGCWVLDEILGKS